MKQQKNTVQMTNSRNASLDLLRVVAMWFVLSLHFFGWGGSWEVLGPRDINYYICMPLYFLSGMGNTIFFILAGYFLSMPKFMKGLFLQRKAAFYAVLGYIIVSLVEGTMIQPLTLLKRWIIPILTSGPYWFLRVYLIVYVLGLVLYPGLKQVSNRQMLVVIAVMLFNNTILYDADMTLMQGLLGAIIGFYLRKAEPFAKFSRIKVFGFFVLTFVMYGMERMLVQHFGLEQTKADTAMRYCLILLMSVLFFAFFEKIAIQWKWPSKIAGNVIAVYLLTMSAMGNPLYDKWLHIREMSVKPWFVVYYVAVNLILFIIIVAIDKGVTLINKAETNLIMSRVKF